MLPSKDPDVPNRQEVVVVDGSPETEEVLRAVFEPRGLDVVRVNSSSRTWRGGVDEASLLVLHGEEPAGAPSDQGPGTGVPRVFIGRIPRDVAPTEAHCRCLPVPFQYADLISAIEELAVASA